MCHKGKAKVTVQANQRKVEHHREPIRTWSKPVQLIVSAGKCRLASDWLRV